VLREERKHQAEMARVRIEAADVWLMKPLTFMNRSGGAVASVAQFYKIAPEEVLVAHDELDFAPGTVRLKQGGGHAGNNGVRDVIATLGEGFWRLRIGVGQPGGPREGIDYVLGRASAPDEQLIRETILEAADAVPVILADGAQKAMNRLHARAPDAPDAG
jgi:PTH1 family peptidyl-tRNA hydrolase